MAKLITFEVKKFPAARLIGKQVRMSLDPGEENPAVLLWRSMRQDGSMELLENIPGRLSEEMDTVGWRGDFDYPGDSFLYIAGVLTKEGTEVPKGYAYRDLPECFMGIGGIQGRDEYPDLYAGAHGLVAQAMKESGYEYDNSAGGYEMEYYSFHRFGVPRYIGEKILILDYYSPCKKIPEGKGEKEAGIIINNCKAKKNFDSLANRIIYAYKSTYPDCIPIEDDRVSGKSQRQMHEFLKEAISSIYNNPSLINLPEQKDEFFEDWMLNNSNPALIDAMRKMEKILLDFYSYLYKLGECGEVKDNKLYVSKDKMKFVKKRLLQLEQFGLFCESNGTAAIFYSEKYPELFPAWKLLCDRKQGSPKGEIVRFIYCMYDTARYKAEHLFGNVTDNSILIKDLEDFFRNKGFRRFFDEFGVHLEKEYPNRQMGKAGFSFDWKKRNQVVISFRVPNFRTVLGHFDEIDHELKELAIFRTKNCDGCGYCTQMDKTGLRKPLVLNLEYEGNRFGKCPLFPNLTWRYIDGREVERIKGLFEFAENI